MKIAGIILLLCTVLLGVPLDTGSINQFISRSIVTENAHHFGLISIEDLSEYELGTPIRLYELTEEVIANYPSQPLAQINSVGFVPILINNIPHFMVQIDTQTGKPTGVGYRTLAEELAQVQTTFEGKKILLFSSIHAKSYLFSVTGNGTDKLIFLQRGWQRQSRSGNNTSETVDILKSLISQGKKSGGAQ